MKRTNLVLDEQLLKTAVQLLGVKTYSAAVNQALAESIRIKRMQKMLQFAGQDVWEGDLSQMRNDRVPGAKSSKKRRV